jgi:hypothetical protein
VTLHCGYCAVLDVSKDRAQSVLWRNQRERDHLGETGVDGRIIPGVQLKSGPYFNISNLFTKIYNMLYYTTILYLQ